MRESFCDSAADYAHSPFPLTGGDTYEERGLTERYRTDEGQGTRERHGDLAIGNPLEVDAAPGFTPEDVLTHTAGVVEEALSA